MQYLGRLTFLAIFIMAGQWSCGARDSDYKQLFEGWDHANDPAIFHMQPIQYDRVSPIGEIRAEKIPWSGYYWPTYKGGLANRWQNKISSQNFEDHLYEPYSIQDAKLLTAEQIKLLSPAEKFDLAFGRLSFPLVKQEMEITRGDVRDGKVPTWFGNCHGWAAAAIEEPRPEKPVVRNSPYGQKVEFLPADISALISGAYSRLKYASANIGLRCNEKEIEKDEFGRAVASRCRDVNPASLHLALHYYVHLAKRPFIVDFENAHQVWNYPVKGYKFVYRNFRLADSSDSHRQFRAPNTVYLVDTNLQLHYIAGASGPTPPQQSRISTLTTSYTLELDHQKRIIGGEWLSDNYPDFIWELRSKPRNRQDKFNYKEVSALLAASVANAPQNGEPNDDNEDDGEDTEVERPDNSDVDRAILHLVNSNYADFLIRRVGLRAEAAYKIRVRYVGPDGTSPSSDDAPFRSIAELRRYITAEDLEVLRKFVTS